MNNVLLLLIFGGLVGLLLVVFYLLDRVNALHNQNVQASLKRPPTDNSFSGLHGKALWDAMTGIPIPGLDEGMLASIKSRYEMVLQKHIELLFEDGTLDGREGFSMPISSERKVPTLRGEMISWIPHEFASGIYRAGHSRATLPREQHGIIAASLDQIGSMLFPACGLPPVQLSKLLMPNWNQEALPKTEMPPALEAPVAEGTEGAAVAAVAAPVPNAPPAEAGANSTPALAGPESAAPEAQLSSQLASQPLAQPPEPVPVAPSQATP